MQQRGLMIICFLCYCYLLNFVNIDNFFLFYQVFLLNHISHFINILFELYFIGSLYFSKYSTNVLSICIKSCQSRIQLIFFCDTELNICHFVSILSKWYLNGKLIELMNKKKEQMSIAKVLVCHVIRVRKQN